MTIMIETNFPHIDYFAFTSRVPLPGILEPEVLSSEPLLPARRMQYQGMMRGPSFVGRASGEYYTECSGASAEDLWWHAMMNGDVEIKASRVDIQITTEAQDINLARVAEGLMNLKNASHFKRHLVVYNTNTTTIYIGSPRSEKRIRVYEKLAEDNSLLVRFEVQFRKKAARAVEKFLRTEHFNSRLYDAIASLLKYEVGRLPILQSDMFDLLAEASSAKVYREKTTGEKFLEDVVQPFVRNRIREDPLFLDKFNEMVVKLVETNADAFVDNY